MNIFKKACLLLLLIGLIGHNYIITFANTNVTLEGNILNYEKSILKMHKGDALIKTMNTFILKADTRTLTKLSLKIMKIKKSLARTDSPLTDKENKILLILNYLSLKIEEQSIYTDLSIMESDIIELNQQIAPVPTIINEGENTLNISEELADTTLSESELKVFNTELIKIQNNLLNNGVLQLESFIEMFSKLTNYEEKGNLRLDITSNMEKQDIKNIDFHLLLQDYIIKNSNFNTQIRTPITSTVNGVSDAGKNYKVFDFSGLIDYIIKDHNYYVGLKNLKLINNGGDNQVDAFIAILKNIEKTKKYVHFEDQNMALMMTYLQTLSPENILKQGKNIANKPLFTAYKKEGNKYFILPTKHFCDYAIKIAHFINPYSRQKCSDTTYKILLNEIKEYKIGIYMTLGTQTTIGFNADNIDRQIEKMRGNISFSGTNIKTISFEVIPDQIKNPKEGAQFNYQRNTSIDGYFYAEKGDIDIQLDSTLDDNNNFTTIDFTAQIEKKPFAHLTLKNNIISGKYEIENYYEKLLGLISGKTDKNNSLSELQIKNQIISIDEYSPFDNISIFDYKNGIFSFSNKYTSQGLISEFLMTGTQKNNSLQSGKITLQMKAKQAQYDNKTYKMVYFGKFDKVFNGNIEFKNNKISGGTKAMKKGNVLVKTLHTGKYNTNHFSLNNTIELSPELNFIETQKQSKKSVIIHSNISIDVKNMTTSLKILFDILSGNKKVFDAQLENTSKRIYKDINISAPKNTIEINEVLKNNNLY